jgi:3-deoxy-D-manno-octulosonic-acid transferase
LKQRFPDFQMVLASEHPQRFAEVERLLKASGVEFEKKSQINGRSLFVEDICFLDTLGELQEFYALETSRSWVGVLLTPEHNLLEPCPVRRPVLWSPHGPFAAIAGR